MANLLRFSIINFKNKCDIFVQLNKKFHKLLFFCSISANGGKFYLKEHVCIHYKTVYHPVAFEGL